MIIGERTDNGEELELDVQRFMKTRGLVMASSGAGKSWTIRRILEQTHDEVKQIVFDPDGEFVSLKDSYEYLLISKGGDIEIDAENAEEHCQIVLENEDSVIIDLSDLDRENRILYVKKFLDKLLDAPQKYWQPIMVIIDEAHRFCPQDKKVDSKDSVIKLMDSGRKRGFAGLLATQRAAKLEKDAAAEGQNKIIGRFAMDLDRKRAGDELGFASKKEVLTLRDLDDGEFYCVGPAISNEVIQVKVGGVETNHPEPPMKKKENTTKYTEKVEKKKQRTRASNTTLTVIGALLSLLGLATDGIFIIPGIIFLVMGLSKIFSKDKGKK